MFSGLRRSLQIVLAHDGGVLPLRDFPKPVYDANEDVLKQIVVNINRLVGSDGSTIMEAAPRLTALLERFAAIVQPGNPAVTALRETVNAELAVLGDRKADFTEVDEMLKVTVPSI